MSWSRLGDNRRWEENRGYSELVLVCRSLVSALWFLIHDKGNSEREAGLGAWASISG